MSYIHVPYDSIAELVKNFKNASFVDSADANFVLIKPSAYYGSYGGLLLKSVIANEEDAIISDSICKDFCLVWWKLPKPKYTGDLNALSLNDRVAVTPSMFKQLQVNPIRKTSTRKSSYYVDKAWSMN